MAATSRGDGRAGARPPRAILTASLGRFPAASWGPIPPEVSLNTRPRTPTAILILAGFVSACGGKDSSPVTPASMAPPPTTTPPVTLPTPQPPPGFASCNRIGPGRPQERCAQETPSFGNEIEASIDELLRERPALFTDVSNGVRVNSTGQFLVAMLEKLDSRGLCANFDGEEVQVKNNNDFNDQYHLITSAQILRRGRSPYQATCYPATFPTPHAGYAPSNGCTLPSSREVSCGREDSLYYGDVERAIDKVARDFPQTYDFNVVQRGTTWWRIAEPAQFVTRMTDAMKSFGYCSRHDGEELVVKRENKVSEHFDIESAEGYVRRGEGIYRSSCYPAAF